MKKILLSGLVALGLFAMGCSNDDVIDNGGKEPGKYDTYLTLSIKSPELKTRTEGSEAADTDGSAIDKVHVYLVKDGMIEHSAETGMETATPTKTKAFEAPTGTYKLFVVINPNAKTPLRKSGNINMVIDEVTEAQAKTGYDGGTHFMMATACDVLDITTLTDQAVIEKANNKGTPAEGQATVDRAAVKINSKTSGDVTSKLEVELKNIEAKGETKPFFEKVDLKGYVLVNGNEKFNLIQKWAASSSTDVVLPTSGPSKFLLDSPQGTVKNKKMTGYYNSIPEFGEVKMDDSGNITGIIDHTVNKTDVFGTDPVFTIENRPTFVENEKLTSGMAQTTGVIYHTVVNDGATFYMFKGTIYKDLADIKKLDEFDKIEDTDWAALTIPQLRAKEIKVYEKGNMYYTYFIQDQNYKVTYKNTAETKYNAVHRNAVYNLTINSIKNIGSDIPGGGEITPENPNPDVDPDETYLNVTVTVNPWVLNDINIDL